MNKKLRIIPLGGVEEVGKNCTAFEYDNNIIVVDLGFDFPGPDLPGIDYILPDISYLKENRDKVKGVIITHGHLDHVGAIPYYFPQLKVPLYGTPLTLGIIEDRLQEEKIKKSSLDLRVMTPNNEFSLGIFKINPFQVVHNIPDSVGLIIDTPLGKVVHTGDFKIDENPVDQKPVPKDKLIELGKKGVLALLSDSTNATLPGHSVPEKEVGKIIDQIIKDAPKRIIFTTFATLTSRIQQVVYACQKHNRKIALVGLSMKKSVKLAEDLGYLKNTSNIFVEGKDIHNYPDKNVLFLAAGAQGGEGSSMDKIADNKHWLVRVKKGDTVIFSSSAVPGNELAIQRTMDGLANQGAKIIYRTVLGSGVHSSGHAFQEELKEMIKMLKPRIFVPVEGQHYMHASHIDLAQKQGILEKNCFMLYDGQVLEIGPDKNAKIIKKRFPHKIITVEGKRIGVLDEKNLEIRKKINESGVCFISAIKKGKSIKIKTDFQGLLIENKVDDQIRQKTKKLIKSYNWPQKKKFIDKIKNSLSDFILSKTGKKPLVVIILN